MFPESEPWPSVEEPLSEQLFAEAAEAGELARDLLQVFMFSGYSQHAADAVLQAEIAASLYHEGLRELGKCPSCGGRYDGDREVCRECRQR